MGNEFADVIKKAKKYDALDRKFKLVCNKGIHEVLYYITKYGLNNTAITEQQALSKIAERFPVGTDQIVKMLETTEALSKQDQFCAPHSCRSQIEIDELINKYKKEIHNYEKYIDGQWACEIDRISGMKIAVEVLKDIVKDLKQLKSSLPTQPELVEVPEFVAEYIKYVKKKGHTLKESLSPFELYGVDYLSVGKWIKVNEDIFARAWLDGYTVKKEPTWVVAITDSEAFSGTVQFDPQGKVYRTTYDNLHAVKFNDKAKAEAVALLIGGEAVPVEEEE